MSGQGSLELYLQPTNKKLCKDQTIQTKALAALKDYYGFSEFRGTQEEAIQEILSGRDVLVLMPTGAGKSLCYGLPPLIKPGIVIVVSPLIALMQDQVQSLNQKGIKAANISSSQPAAERELVMADIKSSKPSTRLLFVTPELLSTDAFRRTLQLMYGAGNLLMVAVDEAHCISSYGHDFRPAYRKLGAIRQELSNLPIMALTATASARVQDDICQQLRLRSPVRLVSSFNRPNIYYEVRYVDAMVGSDGKTPLRSPLSDVAEVLLKESQPNSAGQVPCCIIYTHKRDEADHVAQALRARGIPCKSYHAGMPDRARSAVLADWCAGHLQVVAATVAFGMGIDRSDVRLVIHYNLPKSLEGFYQESGRAGRDGGPSKSILYYSNSDKQSLEYLLQNSVDKLGKRQQQQSASHPTQLQSFGPVVDYCLEGRCRRSFLLAHFGEQYAWAKQAGCCDICDDEPGSNLAIQIAKTAGFTRRQTFLGQRHFLKVDKRLKGTGGTTLEFEMDRPSEGLDFDNESLSNSMHDEDRIEASDEEERGQASRAEAALKRIRQSGTQSADRMLAIMEAAEQQHKQAEQLNDTGQDSKSRLLTKLEFGPKESKRGREGYNTVPEDLRRKARQQLERVLQGNLNLADTLREAAVSTAVQGISKAGNTSAVACALEQQCYQEVQTRSGYQSKMANLVMQVRKAQRTADVLQLDELLFCSQTPEAEAPKAAALRTDERKMSANAAELLSSAANASTSMQNDDNELTVPQLQALMNDIQQLVGRASSHQNDEKAMQAAQALRQLTTAPVSVQVLIQTGAGKQVRAWKKHGCSGIAAAAAKVFNAWRAAVAAV